jgi:CRP/FNR family cyclic AMP-dependent transcriptional regulator
MPSAGAEIARTTLSAWSPRCSSLLTPVAPGTLNVQFNLVTNQMPLRPSSPRDYSQSHNILRGLPQSFSARLLSHAKKISLQKGQVLFAKGDAGDGCYWLDAGILKICIVSNSGEQRILAVLGQGAIVGELAMLDGLPRSATVEAIRDCRLTFVSRAAFARCLADFPDIYGYLVSTLAERLRQADDETAAASFLTVKARIARALMRLSEHLGEKTGPDEITIQYKISQSDLAAMAAVARESVSRTLSDWKRKQIISRPTDQRLTVSITKLEKDVLGTG